MNESQQQAREAWRKIWTGLYPNAVLPKGKTYLDGEGIILSAIERATESASDAYGRGVTNGKLEALKYTPEERERYGKWAAINWPARIDDAIKVYQDAAKLHFGDFRR